MDIPILFEDNHLLVVLKPSGVLSQGGEMNLPNMVDLLKEKIKEKYNKPGNVYLGLVHRLDLNVAGVMVFAKTSKAAKRLSEQIRKHQFDKSYLAIAKGEFDKDSMTYTDYLDKDPEKKQAIITDSKNGKLSQLNFRVIDKAMIDDAVYSLLDIDLETGRFHQIRSQMAHHGHPLYGDTKYGELKMNPDFFLGLFAYQISFNHPISDER
ncbi:MAG TPA: RluA family pseudouridine synthase, partial [Bacillota bacterium]|nr:RluA family pseudouridine synthase [Bacillota bacterium]